MRPPGGRRAGASLLEVQVAMVVLGIALAGACPVIAMQMRLLARFEARSATGDGPPLVRGQRLVDGVPAVPEGEDPAPPVAAIHPDPDRWVRRLGGVATVDEQVGGPPPAPVPTEATHQEADATLVGAWTPSAANGTDNGVTMQIAAGSDAGSAVWTFPAIAPASYRVLLAWPPGAPIPADATVDLLAADATATPTSIPLASAAPGPAGPWLDLGNVPLGPGSGLRLNRSKLGAVFADAVRIGLRNRATILEAPDQTLGPDGGLSARFDVGPRP